MMRSMKHTLSVAATLALLIAPALSAQTSRSAAASPQAKSSGEGFGLGYTDVGPTLGLGGIGSAGIAIGGRFEHAIKALPDMGNGVLGIQASVDWYSYDFGYCPAGTCSITYIPVGATANYHFHVANTKWDPFLGAGLGYFIVSTSYRYSYNSGIYFIGRAGVRYFMSPKLALYGDVGAGAATLNAGLMFRMSGRK